MKCPYCNGRGYEYVERGSSLRYTCPDCDGSGEIDDDDEENNDDDNNEGDKEEDGYED